jgi:hypothetical protein
MGACDFIDYGFGKTAQEAFVACADEAAYEYGHGGYTGTIAEKHEYVLLPTPKTRLPLEDLAYCAIIGGDTITTFRKLKEGEDPCKATRAYYDAATNSMVKQVPVRKKLPQALQEWVQRAHRVTGDKWGPAACVEITGKAATAYRKRHGLKGKRGKVFLFFGLASS